MSVAAARRLAMVPLGRVVGRIEIQIGHVADQAVGPAIARHAGLLAGHEFQCAVGAEMQQRVGLFAASRPPTRPRMPCFASARAWRSLECSSSVGAPARRRRSPSTRRAWPPPRGWKTPKATGRALGSAARGDALSDAKVKVPPAIPLKAHSFALEDMPLYGHWSPVLSTMNFTLNRFGAGDPAVDELLHAFRLNAGVPSSARPLGGWEDPRCEFRGHFTGHYLSACGLMYATSGDVRVKKTGNAIVQGLVECQAKLKGGYLSAFPEEFFDRLEAGKPVCDPYYTLHKIMAGLLEMYVHCDNPQALDACRQMADWVIARNARFSDEQMQKLLEIGHGGMSEVLANLYGLTGEAKYLKMAQRFNHRAVLEPASRARTGLQDCTPTPRSPSSSGPPGSMN